MSVSILIADDHQVVRLGLGTLLASHPDFRVVAEASDGREALQAVETWQPQVLLLDLMLPGLNGLEVARQVSERWPDTKVLIHTMHANEAYVVEALRNGALGYVLKESPTQELIQAIRDVAAGRSFISPALSQRSLEIYQQKSASGVIDLFDTLTTREREVLQLAAEGCSSGDIGSRLFISPRTVETHRANLMRKLNLRSQTDLIRLAIRRGILPPEQ
jgi:DNA-binding NarL/FixJ family response regulator